MTILRNAHISRNRRRRPELLDDPDATLDRLALKRATGGKTPEQQVVEEMFDSVIADAFLALPAHFRDVVSLVDIASLSYREAAEALGIPIGTVMSRLHRARSRMRRQLSAAGVMPRSMRDDARRPDPGQV
jgi:RNA polymerase sigma-70 factor (ECF subfamily)